MPPWAIARPLGLDCFWKLTQELSCAQSFAFPYFEGSLCLWESFWAAQQSLTWFFTSFNKFCLLYGIVLDSIYLSKMICQTEKLDKFSSVPNSKYFPQENQKGKVVSNSWRKKKKKQSITFLKIKECRDTSIDGIIWIVPLNSYFVAKKIWSS